MDAHEFKRLFLPHHKLLYRVAFSMTGNEHDAEDLLQDFYLLLWTKRGQLDERRRTQAYLVTMLRNLCIDRARHVKRRFVEATDDNAPPDERTPEVQVIDSDERRTLDTLIDNLPDRERRVIRLYASEMSFGEMEKTTGMKSGTLRVMVARTKEKLKQQFNEISKQWKRST